MSENYSDKHWYIIQTISRREDITIKALQYKVKSRNMEEYFFNFIAPDMEEKQRTSDGTIKIKKVKVYPGYIFVQMIYTPEGWFLIRNTSGVTGILGSSGNRTLPEIVSDSTMEPILRKCGIFKTPEIRYKVGDSVTIIKGNFKDQTGIVSSINAETNETMVSIEMFGRTVEVPVNAFDIEIVK